VDWTTFTDAFAMADRVLYSGVACITDLIVKEGSLARVPDKGLLGLREGIMFELDAVKRSYTQKPNAVDKRARQIARDKISKAARLSAELSTLLHDGLQPSTLDDDKIIMQLCCGLDLGA
jgi:hypothetical protein